jgi:hypothetical protein
MPRRPLVATVITMSITGAPASANTSQVFEERPAVGMPSASSTFSARGFGPGPPSLPAEKARKRPPPRWLRSASARIDRAELWVQRNRTL